MGTTKEYKKVVMQTAEESDGPNKGGKTVSAVAIAQRVLRRVPARCCEWKQAFQV